MASRSLPLLRAAVRPVARASVARFAPAAAAAAPALRSFAAESSRAFAVSASRLKAVRSDVDLSDSLKEELEYETTDAAEKQTFVHSQESREAIEQLGFKITESAGAEEIVLTKKLDTETIELTFSTSGIETSENPEAELNEEAEEVDDSTSYLPVTISITKSSDPSALVIDAIIEESHFSISDVLYFKDGKLATDKSSAGAEKRDQLYSGPAFDHLDPVVQENFQQFIEERGFNMELADQILEFQRGKEVKEYISWLEGVKKFIDA